MNNAVKNKKNNNNARMKELVLKLRFGDYLMATLTISSKQHSMRRCPFTEQKVLLNKFHLGLLLSNMHLACFYLRCVITYLIIR